jgi:hypothetical protein
MYSQIDKFVEAVRTAVQAAKDIDGISSIEWHLGYNGDAQAVRPLVQQMDKMFREENGKCDSSVKEVG